MFFVFGVDREKMLFESNTWVEWVAKGRYRICCRTHQILSYIANFLSILI